MEPCFRASTVDVRLDTRAGWLLTFYGKSPIGIKYDYNGEINEEDKFFLQKIADEATSRYFNKVLN